jgi:hypothetical protein
MVPSVHHIAWKSSETHLAIALSSMSDDLLP